MKTNKAEKMITINAQYPNDTHGTIQIDDHVDICPICHKNQIANYKSAYVVSKNHAYLIYRCTNLACNEVFVGGFTLYVLEKYTFSYFLYEVPQLEKFDSEIELISKEFVNIYNQALKAESSNLGQISGMGFRKALEFLIKDYAINKEPNKKEQIIKEHSLTKVINGYINDQRIKEISQRASWLGNDETHYSRKWEEMDVQDLKKLIRLTSHWILMDILSDKAMQEMSEGKK